MIIIVPTCQREGYQEGIDTFIANIETEGCSKLPAYVSDETIVSPLPKMQWANEHFPEQDILCYLHDDVVCREPGWDKRVLAQFNDLKVGVVGFGGFQMTFISKLILLMPCHVPFLHHFFCMLPH